MNVPRGSSKNENGFLAIGGTLLDFLLYDAQAWAQIKFCCQIKLQRKQLAKVKRAIQIEFEKY